MSNRTTTIPGPCANSRAVRALENLDASVRLAPDGTLAPVNADRILTALNDVHALRAPEVALDILCAAHWTRDDNTWLVSIGDIVDLLHMAGQFWRATADPYRGTERVSYRA